MRFYQTRRRGSVAGLASPVHDTAELERLQVAGTADRTIIYVEDEAAIYAYDRQSSLPAVYPDIISPTSGIGRWIRTTGGGSSPYTPPPIHVHNKYADHDWEVGPSQQILIFDEYEIQSGIVITLLADSELVIL